MVRYPLYDCNPQIASLPQFPSTHFVASSHSVADRTSCSRTPPTMPLWVNIKKGENYHEKGGGKPQLPITLPWRPPATHRVSTPLKDDGFAENVRKYRRVSQPFLTCDASPADGRTDRPTCRRPAIPLNSLNQATGRCLQPPRQGFLYAELHPLATSWSKTWQL